MAITDFLKVKDNAEGMLNADIVADTNPIVLKANQGALFPATGDFLISIDNEKMLCTAISGDELTVTRGYEGTVAADHLANTPVQLRVVTKHIDDITEAINTAEGDIDTLQADLDTEEAALVTHKADSAVHHHDHDHSASGAEGGSLSTSSLVSGETPGGLINSSNQAFTTASAYTAGSLRVYKNGVRLKGGGNDYTEVAQGFTMVAAPAGGTVLLVDYNTVPSVFATGSTSFIYSELCGGTPNGVLTQFTTASSYVTLSTVVFLDGVRMRRGVDYTESADKQITFTTAPATGSEILIDYQSAVSVSGNADTLDGHHFTEILGLIYPVGSIYTNKTDSRSPATIFGFGTWVALEGVAVVGRKAGDSDFGTAGAVVGGKTHSHSSNTGGQSADHTHGYQIVYTGGTPNIGGGAVARIGTTGATSGGASNDHTHAISLGSGTADSTIQPSVVAYVWERTA
jgi:hypothetical protein